MDFLFFYPKFLFTQNILRYPKLLEAVQNTNKKVYYLNTNTITESEEENRFLEALELDTVPALYLLEKDGEYRKFKFENSENVEVKEIENFLKQN